MLQKQNLNINFAKGIDTKTDPFQLEIGKFANIENAVFTKGGKLIKRNGYGLLSSLPSPATFLTTYDTTLVALGTQLQASNVNGPHWLSKGPMTPIDLKTVSLVRNPINQTQVDTVVAPNGTACVVYTQTNGTTQSYGVSVSDSVTGQPILTPPGNLLIGIDPLLGSPRVFVLGTYFIILYVANIASVYHLRYVAINYNGLSSLPFVDVTVSISPNSSNPAFDAAVLNNSLYIAWNGAAASGIKFVYLNQSLSLSSTTNPDPAHQGTMVNVTTDVFNQVVWIAYYDAVTTYKGYALALSPTAAVLAGFPVQILDYSATPGVIVIQNLGGFANAGLATFFYDVVTVNPVLAFTGNSVKYVTVPQVTPVASAEVQLKNGVYLASKPFSVNGVDYVLVNFVTPYQPTYFLLDFSGNIIAKLAYGNGGGFIACLPNVTVNGETAFVPYLFKDLITAVNKDTNVPTGTQVAGIYSQLGINLAAFTFQVPVTSVEIGGNLNISGGFLTAYDGLAPQENNFHVWPEPVSVALQTDPVITGTTSTSSNVITSVSTTANVGLGMTVTNANIPTGSIISAFTSATITVVDPLTGLPANATGNAVATTLTLTGSQTVGKTYFYQVTYEWTDNQGTAFRSAPSIPVKIVTTSGHSSTKITVAQLRLTAKPLSPTDPRSVKIVIYRWSDDQEIYYQVTSIFYPIINVGGDFIVYVDGESKEAILGNNIIYTNGGVIENIGPPANNGVFLFDDRLWFVDSEDRNLLWFSKQVIENTPVEMSDLLTLYIAPSTGAQGSSLPLTCGFPMDDKAILFKPTSLLYFNGTGPDNTGSNNQYSTPAIITTTVGSSNPYSIVFMPKGLMFEFQSESGNQIWLLGRDLSTFYIGAEMEEITRDATVLSAVNVPGTNEVRFSLSSGITIFYDYFYEKWGTFTGVPAISGVLYQGLHTFLNAQGLVLQETPGKYLDNSRPVLMNFTTGWLNLTGLQGYQRAHFFYLLGQYLSPFILECLIAYDYEPNPSQSTLIAPTNFAPTYGGTGSDGQDTVYGQDDPYGGPGNILRWRLFLDTQRCTAFQITIKEYYDPAFGVPAGEGFSLSGINLVFSQKKGFYPIAAKNTAGSG